MAMTAAATMKTALLDQGEQRHDVEAAEDAEQRQVGEQPPAALRRRKREVEAEERQPDGAEGDEAELHLVPGEALAEERPQPDADREHHEEQGYISRFL
jgi:hypothetical protein